MHPVPSTVDRLLKPLHRWIWADAGRRARKLLRFAETEADGGRDLARAAELTRDPVLRRLYFRHAGDEQRHADLFARRGRELLATQTADRAFEANWLAPGERGLDDLRVEDEADDSLLAFLHLSEHAAAGRFAIYAEVLDSDPQTRALFAHILEDEAFHMTYTRKQLARLSPGKQGLRLWQARAARIWSAYLRLASGIAAMFGHLLLLLQYFLLLPPFAILAKRAARSEPAGLAPVRRPVSLKSQY
ncbi:MAG TPA: ferritin-like domain-containing protein [Myxococcales bacterium]|nr:ferritin-like domain-containing protein [Myxococcales bacterium]